jgi:hypothetical protein
MESGPTIGGGMSEPVEKYPLPKAPIVAAPRAPTDTPHIRFTRKQWIGLPILTLIPLLALFGVFGNSTRSIAVTSPSVSVAITYPERMRYRQTEPLEISVINRGARTLDSMLVSVDTSYLSRFIGVHANPSPTIDFGIPLLSVQPGESRLIAIDLTGDRYWRHPGTVTVFAGAEHTTVTFSTLVFP